MNKIIFAFLITLMISFIPARSQVWELMNPKPTYSWLNGVHFINNDVGWVVGRAGTILKTINNGLDWIDESGIYTNTVGENIFKDVFFINEKVGWISGRTFEKGIPYSQGIILKTTDGGVKWDTSIIISKEDIHKSFEKLFFVNDKFALAAGMMENNSLRGPLLYRTTDGGVNWESLTDRIPDGEYSMMGVHFSDEQRGWMCGYIGKDNGSLVLNTTNGGNEWITSYNIDEKWGGLWDIYFVDSLTGWSVGCMSRSDGDSAGVVIHTSNGGKDWIIDSSVVDKNAVFTTVYFFNKLIGIIGGWTTNENNMRAGSLLKTTDGGKTWRIVFIINDELLNNSEGENYLFRSIHFIDDLNGCAVGDGGNIVVTSDGGDSWHPRFSNPIVINLYGAEFNDTINGWVGGSNNKLFRTKDGCKNWDSYLFDSSLAIISGSRVSESTGWIVGQKSTGTVNGYEGLIYRTTDGGNNWHFQYKLPQPHYNTFFRYVFFLDSLTGWVCGTFFPLPNSVPKPLILKTTDAGVNWSMDTIGISDSRVIITCLYFQDNNNGWACGTIQDVQNSLNIGYSIIRTTDGGKSWAITYLNSGNKLGYLSSVQFKDTKYGWASGAYQKSNNSDSSYILLRTTDGGLKWFEYSIDDNFLWLKYPTFFTDQYGIMIGHNIDEYKPFLYTDNGGANWQTISSVHSKWIYDIKLPIKYHGFAVSSGRGKVFKYKHLYIQTGAPTKTEYCTGEPIQVPFILPDSLRYNITFVAQISDSMGSFDYSPVIGTSERHKSGFIDAVIPKDIPPGDYKIRVWFSENDYSIKVSAAPAPNISGPVNVCKGTVAQYFSGDSSGTQYIWSIEGGSFVSDSTGQSVNVIWNETGYGRISVNVSKTRISCQGLTELRVKVSEPGNIPNHSIEGAELICHTDSDVQEYSSSEQGVKNIWSVSRGTIIGDSSGNSIKIKFLPGIDTVFLKTEVLTGACVTEIYKIVKLDTNNLTRAITGDQVVCLNKEYEYSTSDKNGNIYKWTSDKATIISDDSTETVRFRFTQSGLNTLSLRVSSPFGCRQTHTITIDAGIKEIGIIGDSLICKDTNTIHSYFSKYKGLINEWTVSNAGEIIGETNLDSVRVRWFNQVGIKLLRLKQTLNDGCSSNVSKIIQFKPAELVVSIPEIKYNPTEYYDNTSSIPIYFESFSCGSSFSVNDSLTLIIMTAKSLFLPLKKDNISWTDLDEWRQIEIKLNASDISSENFRYELEGYLLLGDRLESPITIDGIIHGFEDIQLIKTDGKLIVEAVPNVGGLRLLTHRKLQIISVNPNPNEGSFKIKIFAETKQNLSIAIEDILGNKIQVNEFEAAKGENTVEINNLNLPSASYYLKITGNDATDTKLIIINK